ncbi:MAG TPA: SRPBCC family protein [Stellaceae bacterium]|jgi:carbon monoxide dehydrogenase subunit G
MISLSEEVAIAGSPATVWPLLRDPALVAACIPGAALTASGEDGAYRGTIRVKFGPTVAIFRGEAKLAYDDAEQRCTIEGRGIDGRGASRALASGVVTASGARPGGVETTRLKCEGNFNVTGPLETFANAGGVHLARALLAEFAGNMARLAAERAALAPELTPAPDGPSPQPPPREAGRGSEQSQDTPVAAELHGGALLWRAFLGWFRQLFSAKGKAPKGKI